MVVGFNGSGLSKDKVGGWARYAQCLTSALKESFPSDVFRNYSNPGMNHTLWEQLRLPRELKQGKVDVFHGLENGGLPFFSHCPRVLTVHDLFGEELLARTSTLEKLKNLKSLGRYWVDWSISTSRADVVVTISEYVKKSLIEYGLDSKTIHVIYEGIAPIFFPRKVQNSKPFFIYVGSFDARKQVRDLLDIFSSSKLNCDLMIVGKLCTEGNSLKKLFSNDKRIQFHGRVDDERLAQLYSSARAFVTFSTKEGFCLPVVEAMACGCPVIARPESALPEIVASGGVLVQPSEFVSQVERVLNDSAYYQELSQRALARSKFFDWKKTAIETMALYRKLVE